MSLSSNKHTKLNYIVPSIVCFIALVLAYFFSVLDSQSCAIYYTPSWVKALQFVFIALFAVGVIGFLLVYFYNHPSETKEPSQEYDGYGDNEGIT